jgi:hypothetical protein
MTLGHAHFGRPGTRVVAREDVAVGVRTAMEQHGTLYDWAAGHPERRVMQGRLPVYAAPLGPEGPRVVVRRNAHGGTFARWRGDRFVLSRAPLEMAMSAFLLRLGVPTAEVVAYASYRASFLERRVDVMTLQLPPGCDFGAALLEHEDPARRADRWRAVSDLLRALAKLGVWHQDLNVRNIYLIEEPGVPPRAAVLDVDRVRMAHPGKAVARVNSARLLRSMRKWEVARGVRLSEAEVSALDIAHEIS